MKNLSCYVVLFGILFISGVGAPCQDLPPEIAAYNSAVNIRNPELRILALKKLLADSRVVANPTALRFIRQSLLETLAKNYPDRETEIASYVQDILGSSDPDAPGNLDWRAYQVIKPLCAARILTDLTAEIAGSALKKEPPSPSAPSNATVEIMACLGIIQVMKGLLPEAEANLKKVLTWSPRNPTAHLAMAELHLKKNDPGEALKAYVRAAALQRISEPLRFKFESIYRETHNGSIAGLDQLVDQAYLSLTTYKVEPYKSPSKRTVLVETFISSGNSGVIATDRALNLARKRYSAYSDGMRCTQ